MQNKATAKAPSTETGGSVVLIASVAALAGFLFGYDSAVINGATEAIRSQFGVGPGPLGFAVASALIGAALGAFMGGSISDRIGRVAVMKIAAVLFLVSAVGSGLAPEIYTLVVFRIIGGVGMGIASVIAPAYIAEIAPAHIRGRLGSLQQFAIVVGIFLSQLVNKILADLAGGSGAELWMNMAAWRWMLLVEVIPAIGYLVGAYLIPESPRYLIATHKVPEARKVLTRILGERNLEISVNRIQESLDRETKPSIKDIRGAVAGLKPIVWVGIALAIFQQFVGINVVFYYSNTLWQSVGFSESQSFVFSLISATINVTVTIVAILLVDKVGRKPLLLVGSVGMALSLGAMAVIFAMAPVTDGGPVLEGAAGPIALVCANLFVVFFGVSWGPVMWVMLGEMFPNRIRGAALAVAGFAQWFANFLVTQTFPPLAEFSLGLAYGLYAAFAALSFLFVAKFVPETKGRELEDMTD
ncbi:MAG: sugar porter family MFS transporter [Propionibacterium sp.]|nr:sugar porter family MFS transporter [Propionibacterium sp.]